MEKAMNIRVDNVELRWARLAKPVVNPFTKKEQYELQIATTDAAKAQEMRDAHMNVKEKDGVFTASLKRKAQKADGSDNGMVRVVDGNRQPFEDVASIGNGSIGNVIVWAYPYESPQGKGISTSLTAVQVVKHEVFQADGVGFDVVGDAETSEEPAAAAELF